MYTDKQASLWWWIVPALAILIGGCCLTIPVVRTSYSTPSQVSNNLRQIGIALHNYHDTNDGFPPAALRDPDGRPLLSWRVLILPYLEQQNLFEEFRLDAPWDSPHNAPLLMKMPKVYEPMRANRPPGETPCQAFVGPGTMFELARGKMPHDFPDGLSNTIMVVEAEERVPWTKPADLIYDPTGPLPALYVRPYGDDKENVLGMTFPKKKASFVLMGDAAVRKVPPRTKEGLLRALITRNGGETLDLTSLE